ncbi:MAG: hypothetical protein HY801_10520 [Candidatus Lindowbacteria bacterium]|nr:hypothetical protein [Candidatus Lindowbacteria bacterium]
MKKSITCAKSAAVLAFLASLGCLVLASCASAPPQYPAAYAPQPKTAPVELETVFQTARRVLNNDGRLVVDTVDKAGRFIAYEKTSGLIFLRHRTILDIRLEAVGPDQTKISVSAKAQDYEIGGFTREAGWYPSTNVYEFLVNDIMGLIEKETLKAKKQ